MDYKIITTDELSGLLSDQSQFYLVDILPEDFFLETHIPGSINIDGYKMDFLKLAEEQIPDKKQTVVVYGSGPDSEAADYAAARLVQKGWKNVYAYKGGLEEWTDAGNRIEGTEFPGPERPADKIYDVDVTNSVVNWSGRSLNVAHFGTIKFKSGTVTVRAETIASADLVLDMSTIKNLDLAPDQAEILEKHLKSEDFFHVEKYPTARIRIERTREIGEPDLRVFILECYGTLQIKDVSKEIVLHAQFSFNPASKQLKISSLINLDRTIWNVKYGSTKFFKMLGKHIVDDIITLDVHVVAV